MKKIIYALLAITPLLVASCSDDDDIVAVTSPVATGTVTDNLGNTYEWVRIGNLDWTTSNAKNGMPVYDYTFFNKWNDANVTFTYGDEFGNDMDYIDNWYNPRYGNPMSQEEAMTSAPDGWRLPSDEDWKALERSLGVTDVDSKGWRGSADAVSRMTATNTGVRLGLQYAGGAVLSKSYNSFVLEFDNIGAFGYYWTSTVEKKSNDDRDLAYYRKIVYGAPGVERQSANVMDIMSVRWCRNAAND